MTMARERSDQGSISLLQEFVQSSRKSVQAPPPHRRVLQWNFDSRTDPVTAYIEFRATVAFSLDGVPHHVLGAWKRAKKLAQRDAAEASLGLFAGLWSQQLVDLKKGHVMHKKSLPSEVCGRSVLDTFDQALPLFVDSPFFVLRRKGGSHQAVLHVQVMTVAHAFIGRPCVTEKGAKEDVARRLLWYLQVPGFTDEFEVDIHRDALDIPMPPPGWENPDLNCSEDERGWKT